MCARRIASRNSGSSAASIVICVKNTVSDGQTLEAGHQLESLGTSGLELLEMTGIVPARCHPQILERHWIEVVVGQRDEPESTTTEIDDLFEHLVDVPLPRLLTVGSPDGAERAVLRTPADGLHRRPHVAPARQQIPAAGQERLAADAPAVVARSRCAGSAVLQRHRPGLLAVTSHDGVRTTKFARFVGIERRVDPAIHNVGASRARGSCRSRSRGVRCLCGCRCRRRHPPGSTPRSNVSSVSSIESGLSVQRRRRRRQDIQPSRRDDADAKRNVAWIDKVDGHAADACRTSALEM